VEVAAAAAAEDCIKDAGRIKVKLKVVLDDIQCANQCNRCHRQLH